MYTVVAAYQTYISTLYSDQMTHDVISDSLEAKLEFSLVGPRVGPPEGVITRHVYSIQNANWKATYETT